MAKTGCGNDMIMQLYPDREIPALEARNYISKHSFFHVIDSVVGTDNLRNT